MEVFILWILFGIVCAVIAKTRGRDVPKWFFCGVLLGPIGVLLVLVLPKMTGEQFRKCPYCGELVKREAIKCRYCQRVLSLATADKSIKQRNSILQSGFRKTYLENQTIWNCSGSILSLSALSSLPALSQQID